MNLITRLIGLNILIVMLWGTAMLGGKLGIYLDIPSIIMVTGVLFGGALLCFPVHQITDAFGAAFEAESAEPVDAWQRQQRIAVFARLYQLAWGGGLVGALLGLIAMLSDLSDPASIGAGMAVALLAPAYGALLAEFIFNPMQQLIMNQPPTDDGPGDADQRDPIPTPVPPRGQTALFKGVALIAIIVSMFMVPIVSFSEIKKNDAFDAQAEATYLRYLYGDNAPVPEVSAAEAEFRVLVEQRIKELESQPVDDGYDPAQSLIERLEEIRIRTGRIPEAGDNE